MERAPTTAGCWKKFLPLKKVPLPIALKSTMDDAVARLSRVDFEIDRASIQIWTPLRTINTYCVFSLKIA